MICEHCIKLFSNNDPLPVNATPCFNPKCIILKYSIREIVTCSLNRNIVQAFTDDPKVVGIRFSLTDYSDLRLLNVVSHNLKESIRPFIKKYEYLNLLG